MQDKLKAIFAPGQDLDPRSVEFLTNALVNSSAEGFDYLKFKQSLQALAKLKMGKETSFKSAFATASTLGVTKEKLAKSAAQYIQILNKEKEQFDAALKKQMQQRVASKKDETIYLQEKIKEYQLRIKELEKQVVELQKRVNSADKEIEKAKEKIETTKLKFEATYQTFAKEIQQDIALIEKYL